MNEDLVFFSVVIPAYNIASLLRTCLESILANTFPRNTYEIIVVDGGSEDGTAEIARGLGARVISAGCDKRKNIGTLRNIGAEVAKGSVLAFLDADIVVPPDWLEKAAVRFNSGYYGALGFVSTVPASAGWVARVWGDLSVRKARAFRNSDFLPGSNIFLNREIFDRIGGFDASLPTSEDKDLGFRVSKTGHKLMLSPETSVIHLGFEKNLVDFLKKEFWRQGDTLAFAKRQGMSLRTLRHPSLSFWHILMPAMILLLLFVPAPIYAILIALTLWIAPSFIILCSDISGKAAPGYLASLWLLTFLRWNMAGLALIKQLAQRPFKGKSNG